MSRINLLPESNDRHLQQDMVLANLSLETHDRRTRSIRRSFRRRTMSSNETKQDSNYVARKNTVAWQTMNQHLNLQLEEYQHISELTTDHHRQLSLIDVEQQQPTTVRIDDEGLSSVVNKNLTTSYNSSSNTHLIVNLDNITDKEKDVLTTDIHIASIETLVQRFNSNLHQGLMNDIVAQHRIQFGENKLTPPPKPSLLWMFTKQSLVGFNGILWIATIFAFLSYVC